MCRKPDARACVLFVFLQLWPNGSFVAARTKHLELVLQPVASRGLGLHKHRQAYRIIAVDACPKSACLFCPVLAICLCRCCHKHNASRHICARRQTSQLP